jgi:hypothetical protein
MDYNNSPGTNLFAANKKLILQGEKHEFNIHVLYCGAVSYNRKLLEF